jgi:hypothetical protein
MLNYHRINYLLDAEGRDASSRKGAWELWELWDAVNISEYRELNGTTNDELERVWNER